MTAPAYQAVIAAPGFCLGIRCDDDEILGIEFLEPSAEIAPTSLLAKEATRQLRAWMKGPNYVFGLPLRPHGTPFQRRVWAAIAAIPAGQTLSYGDLAKALASGPRAVGGACGANPYPIIVPCHRVVAAVGLGGFGGGSARLVHKLPAVAPSPGDRAAANAVASPDPITSGTSPGTSFLLGVKRWLLSREGVR
jgi:methylated-DNA-[protein]-cysteine S-methyltransferase